MKITLFIYEKVRGALIGGARSEFLCFHNQGMDCVANLYLLPTQYCICIRWRMMKVPGCGVAGQKLILALFDHFIFTSQARILSEWTQWTRAITHFIHSAFTSLLGIYMESGNWFEMIWTETSSDGEHPGLSLSSFLIIKCKSLAGPRGFQLYGVFYWGFWPSQNGHRWLLAAAVTSLAISRGALPI